MAETHGMNAAEVMEACADGVRAAERDTGVRANIIGILSRTYGIETCMKELDAILAHRDHIVAVDLAGDEAGYPADPVSYTHLTLPTVHKVSGLLFMTLAQSASDMGSAPLKIPPWWITWWPTISGWSPVQLQICTSVR